MIYQIGQLADIIDGDRGKNYPKQNEFLSHGYCLFLNAGNVTRTGFSFEENLFITQEKDNLLRKGKLQRGDIVYTTRGTVGNAAFYSEAVPFENIRINSGMVILRCHEDVVDKRYLYQILKSEFYRPYFKKYCTGSAQPQLPIMNFSKIELNIPEIETQRRIADILSAYDDLIENNQRQIKLLEEAAQRLYKEWFVDLRFPGYENTKILDGVPEGWKIRSVNDFGEVITGKTPPTSKPEYYNGNIPFVTIPDMHDTIFPLSTEKYLSEQGANTQKNKFLPPNSVMVSCIATVGLVSITSELCQTNQQINSVILKDEKDLYFFYCAMKRIKSLLDGVGSNGATMTNVNKTKFENIKVLYPERCLTNCFFEFSKPIFRRILILNQENQRLQEARDRLLPKLMSGELEV